MAEFKDVERLVRNEIHLCVTGVVEELINHDPVLWSEADNNQTLNCGWCGDSAMSFMGGD